MAVFAGVSSLQWALIGADSSTDLHSFNLIPCAIQPRPPLMQNSGASKAFVLPTIEPHTARVGTYSAGVDQEFYGHIILWPTAINLGLVLTAKYYDLSLWNLTGYSQTLTDWVITGLDGTTVTNADGSPVQFGQGRAAIGD